MKLVRHQKSLATQGILPFSSFSVIFSCFTFCKRAQYIKLELSSCLNY
jgi:hypothetical protein